MYPKSNNSNPDRLVRTRLYRAAMPLASTLLLPRTCVQARVWLSLIFVHATSNSAKNCRFAQSLEQITNRWWDHHSESFSN